MSQQQLATEQNAITLVPPAIRECLNKAFAITEEPFAAPFYAKLIPDF